ncbi:MAG TPA: hypothetical protein VF575_05530 [Candidatus Saccharimonadales bacterium]|jgi:uncharacterized coiled-coil DUF342 family protein
MQPNTTQNSREGYIYVNPATSSTDATVTPTKPTPSIDEAVIVEQALPAARASQMTQIPAEQLSESGNAQQTTPQSDSVEDEPANSKKQLGSAIEPVTATGEQTRQLASKLRSEADRAEAELDKAEQEIKQAENELKQKSGGSGSSAATIAGYPVAELAKAFFRPPKPADNKPPDPEIKQAQQEIDQTKKQVKEAKKHVAKIKKEADKFQKQELPSLQSLQGITSKLK